MAIAIGTEVEGIDKRWSLFKEVPTIIDEKFEDGRGYALDALRVANETIDKLVDVANELNNIDVNISIEDITVPDIQDFVGETPDKPTIQLNLPPELTDTDDIQDALHDKLLADLQTPSPAISDDVEDAIFKKDTERALLAHQDNLDRISAEWSKRGFTLPDGMLWAALSQAEIEYANKRLDVSRDIAIKNFELTDTNMKFVVEKSLQWYATRIETYKTKVQAEIARVEAVVKAFLGEVEAFKAETMVYNSIIDVKIKKFDAQVRAALARAELLIKDAEIDMKNFEVTNNLKIEAMKAIGSINAQIVAGALSSVSAAVHMSASNASQYSYNTNPSY